MENATTESVESSNAVAYKGSAVESLLKNNSRNLVLAAVILIVGVVGYWYFGIYSEEMEETSSLAFSRAKVYFERGDYTGALNGDTKSTVRGEQVVGLLEIVESYGGTSAGKTAALLAGNCYISLEKYGEALPMFDKARGSSSSIVKAGASAGIAACQEFSKEYAEAAKNYEEASRLMEDAGDEARYKYFAALCYEKSGDRNKAEQVFSTISKAHRDTEYANMALSAMSRLGMIIE